MSNNINTIWRTIKSSISALRYSEDQYGKAFIIAADTGDLDKMLEHIGARGVSYQDEYGQRPLHRASRRGHAAAVRMLLEYGSDPNACDHVGAYTAVQYAAHYQHAEVVRLLVSYGADVYYQNRIACRPATYYAHRYPLVKTAIQQGTSDLYIHRSIAAQFLIENLDDEYLSFFNSQTLKHSISMKIIEFLPRHQLWTQVKTRYITNKTSNWHSRDLFSEKHLENQKKNTIHSCKYHGEFDVDKDWDDNHNGYQNSFGNMINDYSEDEDVDESDYSDDEYLDENDEDYTSTDDDEDDRKYPQEDDYRHYSSNTSYSSSNLSYSSSPTTPRHSKSNKSLSSDDDNSSDHNGNSSLVVNRNRRNKQRNRTKRQRRNNHHNGYRHRHQNRRRNDNRHILNNNALTHNNNNNNGDYFNVISNANLLFILTLIITIIAIYFGETIWDNAEDYVQQFMQFIIELWNYFILMLFNDSKS